MKKSNLKDQRLIEARQIIEDFVTTLDMIQITPSFSDVVDSILKCRGKIIVSGLGKAGIAMTKFSSTLCSFGVPSCYLHPGEASHGNLGIISPNDILIIASTSGKTREILELIELARVIKVKRVIGITSHLDSPIRKKADIVLDMGVIEEAGHLGIAPTSSILVMLALTDCLALVVAKEKGVTKKDYSKYHHSGYLGALARGKDKIY